MESLKRQRSEEDDSYRDNKRITDVLKLDDLNNKRETTTVLVKNLPKSTNIHQIKRYFDECGSIAFVDFIKGLQLAKIQFENYEDALSALTKTYKIYNLKNPINGKGNEITVEWYRDSTLWCTNYPPSYTLSDLTKLFEKFGGHVINVRTPSLRYNSNRRFAYVDMLSSEEAHTCAEALNEHLLEEKYSLVVKISDPSQKSQRTDQSLLEGREVLLKNIEDVDQNMITEYLKIYGGEIEKFSIPKSNTSIAWCSFVSRAAVDNLVTKSTTFKIDDKIIYIQKADKKAYLERQTIKDLFQLPRSDPLYDHYVSIFPISDKYNKERVKAIILQNTSLTNSDIASVILVTDHEGALVQLQDPKKSSKTMLELKGKNLNKNVLLNCADIYTLKTHWPSRNEDKKSPESITAAPSVKTKTMTNADFKSLLYK